MNVNELRKYWESVEKEAKIKGWDFSHIEGKFEQCELPWDFSEIIHRYMHDTDRILDIDTGGGEFLLSLGHPCSLTSATEGYPPNVELCRRKLGELGIDFHEMNDYSAMPFADEQFDVVLDRHGAYDADEVYRVLKHGGYFITQQVGEENDRELVELLLPELKFEPKGFNLGVQSEIFRKAGFNIIEQDEVFRPTRFFETGALVWFAKIIEWEFVGFSVEKCFENLIAVEKQIQNKGSADGRIHRFYLVAEKM